MNTEATIKKTFDFSLLNSHLDASVFEEEIMDTFQDSYKKCTNIYHGGKLITTEELLSFTLDNITKDYVRLFRVKDGIQTELTKHERFEFINLNSSDAIEKEIREQNAIIIQEPELHFDRFKDLIDVFKSCFGCEVTGSIVYSPGQAVPTSIHYDSYHVFALQITGKKNWKIFENEQNLNIYRNGISSRPKYTSKELGMLEEFTLNKNDILYVPSGMYHHVTNTCDESSIHIAITIRFDRYGSMFEDLVKNALVKMSYQTNNRKLFESDYAENSLLFQDMSIALSSILETDIKNKRYLLNQQEKGDQYDNKKSPLDSIDLETEREVVFTWVYWPNRVRYEYDQKVSVYFEFKKSIVFDLELWELIIHTSSFKLSDIKKSEFFEDRWIAILSACVEDYGSFDLQFKKNLESEKNNIYTQ